MSRVRLSLAASAMLLTLGSSTLARADVAYSYEVENADANPDKVLVVWPRACGAKGEPLGQVDLKLNPDWASRMHEVDYEVVVRGAKHTLLDHCVASSRLHALPAGEFPKGTRVSTGDDMSIGQMEAGAPFAILPALDAIDLAKRIDFFEKDARVLRTSFRFAAARSSWPAGVKAVHDVLEVGGFDGTSFTVKSKRALYTHSDGHTETVTDPGKAAPASPASAVPPAAPVSAPPSPAAPPDGGTRWVALAAVAGLVVGGLIAYRRKQRDAATK